MPRFSRRAIFAVLLTASSAVAQSIGPGVDPEREPRAGAEAIEPATAAAQPTISRDLGSLPLGIPADASEPSRPTGLIGSAETGGPSPSSGLARPLVALAGVLTLILILAWAFKKVAARSGGLAGAVGAGGRAPAGLVEVLARYPVASRQTLVVLRFDRRVLLCCMTAGARGASAGMSTLCELDDPEDVASVLLKTRDEAGESIARSFERSLRDADEYAPRADHVEIAHRSRPARVGGAEDGVNPLARGLEVLWRGRGG